MGLLGDIIPFVNPMTAPFAIADKLSGGGLQKGFGQMTGFGGYGGIDPQNTDPEAYKELFEKALAEMQGVGMDPASQAQKGQINNILSGQLGDLENQAEGRKANFLQDMGRSFATDRQNLARSAGGTGTMANLMGGQNLGQAYDSQARQVSRGLNDLYSQATKDLGSLQGVQGNMEDQQYRKASGLADVYGRELNSRRGVVAQNNENTFNANQERYNRQRDTINTAGNLFAKKAGIA